MKNPRKKREDVLPVSSGVTVSSTLFSVARQMKCLQKNEGYKEDGGTMHSPPIIISLLVLCSKYIIMHILQYVYMYLVLCTIIKKSISFIL